MLFVCLWHTGYSLTAITGTKSLCAASTTALSDATAGGTWHSGNTAVATLTSSSGTVHGVAAGTAVISYTKSGVVVTAVVTVNPLPNAGTISGTATVCTSHTTLLSNATAGGAWSSTATAIATVNTTGTVYAVAAGNATISYTLTNGCGTRAATKVVTVSALPVAGSITGTATVCAGHTTTLSDAAGSGVWSSTITGIATINTSGKVTAVAAGTTIISYTKTSTCGAVAATVVVTVSAAPVAATISGASAVCVAATTALLASAGGGVWSSSATSNAVVGATGIVTGVSTGTTNIKYTIANTCGSTVTTKAVTVNGLPSAGSVSGTAKACPGATATLTASVSGGAWSSSATGIAVVNTSGVVSGVTSGIATISYTSINGCGSVVATKIFTVNSLPATGAITVPGMACVGTTTTLTDAGITGGSWSSATTAVANINHSSGILTGVSVGTTTISYTLSNTCGSAAATAVVTVGTLPVAGAVTGAAATCLPGTIALSATSGAGGVWSSGEMGVATVSSAGVASGVSAGTASISYTSTNTCGSVSATAVVTINAVPAPGAITGITTTSIGGPGTALSNSLTGGTWNSTTTAVATVNAGGIVTGVSAGTTMISYTVTNSCGTATVTTVVTVSAITVVSTGTLMHGKIPIDANRWYQLNNVSNGLQGLFDSVLDESVETGWGKILDQYDAYYPVMPGEQINIDSIKFYDGEGTNEDDPFTLYYIDSLWNRVQIATFVGSRYNSWVGPDPTSLDNYNLAVAAHNVKYLLIRCTGTYPNEMMLFGSYIAPNAVPAVPAKTIRLSQEFGVNGFEWNFEDPNDPSIVDSGMMTAVKSFTAVRHYLDWEKLEPTQGGYTFNPAHDGSWNYDTMYARCKTDGIEVLADIKTQPDWLIATYPHSKQDAENVPVPYGSDFTAPASYIKQAKVAFQFAARYGYNPLVSSSLLSVDPTTRWTGDPANVVKKGLGLIKYIECDNERDKWWKGRNAYQTGREYAANMSAFYDGNRNTMGPGAGVKNADSTMKVVMGGVALPSTDYFRGMIDWCKEFRGYNADGSVNLCWDVINYHIYPCDGSTQGLAPEVAHADSTAINFVHAAHMYAKDMPVWVTETGYDINQESSLKAIPIGSKSAQQTQADWSLRNALLYARCGVERTFFYEMYDDDTSNPTNYASSGFINPDHSRKPEADYLYQANRLMGNYAYQETISTNPLVDRYELAGHSAYVLVKPTEDGSSVAYSLTLPGSPAAVNVYQPVAGQDSMSVTSMVTTGSSVSLTVTETPMFVTVGAPLSGGRHSAPASVVNNVFAQSVLVYPNPAAGTVNLSIENDKEGDVSVALYNAAGVAFGNYSFKKQPGRFVQTIDISSLAGGIYFMDIACAGDKTIKKIIKVNQ